MAFPTNPTDADRHREGKTDYFASGGRWVKRRPVDVAFLDSPNIAGYTSFVCPRNETHRRAESLIVITGTFAPKDHHSSFAVGIHKNGTLMTPPTGGSGVLKWEGSGKTYTNWTASESNETGKFFILPGQEDNDRYVKKGAALHFELQLIKYDASQTLMFWRMKWTDVPAHVFAVVGKVVWPVAIGDIEDVEFFPVHGGQISSGSAVAEWY